jgi:hypothetical protein
MKARFATIGLIMALVFTLATVAPAVASSDEAQIKSIIKNYMTLVAQGDFQSAMKLKIKKLSIPPKGGFRYRMIIRLAKAFIRVQRVEIKGDRAKAYFNMDPEVVEDVVKQVFQYELDRAKKISDPKRRAAMVARLEKNKDQMIAYRVRTMINSTMILQKQNNKWMII